MNRFAAELRAEVSGDKLRGHAAVFGPLAQMRGHYEALAATAFDAALKSSDARALVNHNPSLLLGRQSAGTLRLGVDSTGLEFEVDLPNTTYANDLRELVSRGDLRDMSFGFIPGADTWSKAPDGSQLRTHTDVAQLLDVSPVTYPAYDGTDVALRAYDFTSSPRNRLIRARARLALGGH